MWRRALVAFLGSVLGTGVGIGLLYGAFIYIYGGKVGEGPVVNIVISLHIFSALSIAAAIWGGIVGTPGTALRAGITCLVALILSGLVAFGLLMLALEYVPQPDFLVFWPITAVIATLAAAIGGAIMGRGLGGERWWWRAALAGAIPTGIVFAVPFTTALLMFAQSAALVLLFGPFVVLATYLGAVIPSLTAELRVEKEK
jgi:hypothetical protein